MKSLFLIPAFISLSFWLVPQTVSAQKTDQIEVCEKKTNFSYCFSQGQGSRRHEVLYFFHGVLGSEKTWNNSSYYEKIRQQWLQQKSAPAVIALSLGRVWLLTPPSTARFSGQMDLLLPQELLQIEKKQMGRHAQKRWAMGDSMGGHNVLQYHLQHPHFFKHIYALCPAQFLNSPFIPISQLNQMASNIGANVAFLTSVAELMKAHYDESTWKTHSLFNLSPGQFRRLRNVRLVSAANDPYGFDFMNQKWLEKARQRGADIRAFYEHGYHCYPEPISNWFQD